MFHMSQSEYCLSSKSIADAVVTKKLKIPTDKIEKICEYFLSILLKNYLQT